jgi:hypothetical protein
VAVSYDSFLARFPEFKPGGNTQQQTDAAAVIVTELTRAAGHVNSAVWGDQADDGVAYLAAHRIAIRPGGFFARIPVGKDGTTTYGKEFDRMRSMLLVGDRVI